jgi:hypothetical protein
VRGNLGDSFFLKINEKNKTSGRQEHVRLWSPMFAFGAKEKRETGILLEGKPCLCYKSHLITNYFRLSWYNERRPCLQYTVL